MNSSEMNLLKLLELITIPTNEHLCQKTILHPRTTISKEMIPHPEQKLNCLLLRVIPENRINIVYFSLTESWNPALDADDYYYC